MDKIPTRKRRPVVIYAGRFQPFHRGHYSIYSELVSRFGEDRVFIATSDTVSEESPLSFGDRVRVMTKMFYINSDMIVMTKNPYRPYEILDSFTKDTPLIMPISEKDSERLTSGQYFREFEDGSPLLGYEDAGYYLVLPEYKMDIDGENISGTLIRTIFGSDSISADAKADVFKKIYGKVDDDVFKLLIDSFTSSQEDYSTPDTDMEDSRDLLKHFITNPKNGIQIPVKIALQYPKNTEVYRLANREVRNLQESTLLTETSAAGHMLHPYEDYGLTFADLKEIIEEALIGDFSGEIVEKLDGQNLMFTVIDGEVKFARKKSHIKNFGENAISADELREEFAGREEIQDSYYRAASDIVRAMKSLRKGDLWNFFANGQKFVSVEIINSNNENLIPYGRDIIVVHGIYSFNTLGSPVHFNHGVSDMFVSALKKVNAEDQATYGIRGPNTIAFGNEDEYEYKDLCDLYRKELDGLIHSCGLDDYATIGDYLEKLWREDLETIPWLAPNDVDGLVSRWVYGNKTFGFRNFKEPESVKWFRVMDSRAKKINESFIYPIKLLILRVGAKSIQRSVNILTAYNPEATTKIMKELETALSMIAQAPEDEKIEELKAQIEYLNNVGLDNVVPSEGMVFPWKEKIYKLTGAFAPLHQLTRVVKFGLLDKAKKTLEK